MHPPHSHSFIHSLYFTKKNFLVSSTSDFSIGISVVGGHFVVHLITDVIYFNVAVQECVCRCYLRHLICHCIKADVLSPPQSPELNQIDFYL
jgi:hypothetical protein